MTRRNTSGDQEKFRDAGEQAARVIGEFVSMANEFSRRIDGQFDCRSDGNASNRASYHDDVAKRADHVDQSTNASTNDSNRENEDWQKGNDYLRELGDAAASAIDGFTGGLNSNEVFKAGNGESQVNRDWMDKAAELLKQRDPLDFFNHMKSYAEQSPTPADKNDAVVKSDSPNHSQGHVQRHNKLAGLFSDSKALEELTDSQFDELYEFMKANYQSALQLVRNK